MTKYLLLLFISFGTALSAQSGVQFAEGSWSSILQQAAKENKLIFLDAYTTWCGPCKQMVKEVFPDKKLGKYYNEHFINAQVDMESGEGSELAVRYKVRAYPSLLYINGNGEVVHRIVGYHDPEQLLEAGETANDPDLNLAGLTRRFEAGERDEDFLLKLAMAHSNAMDGQHMKPLEAYFKLQEDWTTMENMQLLFMLADDMDSPLFEYLANNREKFELMFGKSAVVSKLQQLVNEKLFAGSRQMPSLESVDELYAKAYPDMADKLSARFRIDYYRMSGEEEQYLGAIAHYLETYSSEDAMELNNAAWNFYEMAKERDQLKLALAWAQKSVQLEPAYYNHDTLASLYYKLGEKKKAIKTAKQAIEIAKASGEDYASTSALLDAIKSK